MPLINPDTSAVTEQGAIDPGTYKAKITAVELKTAKSSGNPMLEVSFDVQVGEATRPRRAYLPITGQGAFGFDQLLRATGFVEYADKLKAGEKAPFDTDQLIGQELNVRAEHDTYNGQVRDKIAGYLPA